VTSTAKDGDFFLKLQDVDQNGISTFIADGALRASYRALKQPPYNFFGAPWICACEDAREDLSSEAPAELVITLNPTSYILQKGHRFRLTITGSDAAIGPSPAFDPPPLLRLFRSRDHNSSITLPVIPSSGTTSST
jgi:predicted acyl esterase